MAILGNDTTQPGPPTDPDTAAATRSSVAGIADQVGTRIDAVAAPKNPLALTLPGNLGSALAALGKRLTPAAQAELAARSDAPEGERSFLRPEFPALLPPHLNAYHALIAAMREAGDISPETADILHAFAERHDIGYRLDMAAVMKEKEELFRTILTEHAVSLGIAAEVAPARADALMKFLEKHKDNYLVHKILGHGVTGMVLNVEWFVSQGIDRGQAMTLAQLFAAHHPGFPINRLIADGFGKLGPHLPRCAALSVQPMAILS